MGKDTILVVEDAPDISSLLSIYLTSKGYQVLTTNRGHAAIEICRMTPPHLALLDVGLPDIEGFEVGKALRASPRTRHIPIIFLTARGERHDRLRGLGEVQAQYYIVKPFDIEEVYAVVKNQLDDWRRKNLSHPVTSLPTADALSDQLRALLTREDWALGLIHIQGFDSFTQSYGLLAGEDVLKHTAALLRDAVLELGGAEDFIGQVVVGAQFLLVSTPDRVESICEQLIRRFDAEIARHYQHEDRQRGYVKSPDESGTLRQLALMTLSIGVLTSADGPFYDIRQLNEQLEATRQLATVLGAERGHGSMVAYGRAS